eukprot:scaffold307947_cov27-Tisochrysis_lutea.AAC.2
MPRIGARQLSQSVGELLDGLWIQSTGWLIQDEDGLPTSHQAGEATPLPLPAREELAAVPDARVHTCREPHDLLVQPCQLACFDGIILSGVLEAQKDVFEDSPVEEGVLLLHDYHDVRQHGVVQALAA